MKRILLNFWLTMLLAAPLCAQVIDIGQYKGTVYQQAGPSLVVPNTPDNYYFANLLDSDPAKALSYSLFMIFTPATNNNEVIMTEFSTYFSRYNSPYYQDKTNFDAAFPNGLFTYVTTYSDPTDNTPKSDNVLVQTPTNDLFSATLPAFSPDCWTAMQAVDPSADFDLSWNSYVPTPGADYAFSFVSTYDSQTFNSVYGGFNFNGPPQITSTTIPAGSLDYGRTYIVQLFFSNRVTPAVTNTDGSAVSVIVGYDNVTDATLVTIPPPLQIALTDNQVVTLTWPTLATNNYVLQTSLQLDCPNCWTNVTNSPDDNGSMSSLTLMATNTQAFFRLAPVSP